MGLPTFDDLFVAAAFHNSKTKDTITPLRLPAPTRYDLMKGHNDLKKTLLKRKWFGALLVVLAILAIAFVFLMVSYPTVAKHSNLIQVGMSIDEVRQTIWGEPDAMYLHPEGYETAYWDTMDGRLVVRLTNNIVDAKEEVHENPLQWTWIRFLVWIRSLIILV